MRSRTRFIIGFSAATAAAGCTTAALVSSDSVSSNDSQSTAVSEPRSQPAPASGAQPRGQFSPEQLVGSLGQQLVAGLQISPGCLGADAAAFASGKLVIIGWFEDKAAALAWHANPMHTQVSQRFSGGRMMDRVPMEHIPDEQPLMVIASVSVTPPEQAGKQPQMAFGIEVYQPMPGGFSFQGGAFSPSGFQELMAEMREQAQD